jgi:two-component system, cell cycle sensor histidine kinase and response regulator CckA
MESLGLLAGGVAHDLNNVLSGIVSYPQVLLLQLPEESKLRKPMETIQKSGQRAAEIVQDLLTVARGAVISKEPLNLNDVIGEYLKSPECGRLLQYHPGVTVKTRSDPLLLNVKGSSAHIRKVLMNLVSNASEAIDGAGDVVVSTMNRRIERPLKGYESIKSGEYAVVAVADSGSGISADDLQRIFEPFYTKKVLGRSGTGLGLTVVWNVVQDHNGYIDVATDSRGTRFELYFPVTEEPVRNKKPSVPLDDLQGRGETILVVDDVKTQREITCQMVEALGYRAMAVSGGEEAVDYLKDHSVDLLLLDMIMDPGISGRETYERIKKIRPRQKAIIVSGFAETAQVRETLKSGAGRYLKKPLILAELGAALKEELY